MSTESASKSPRRLLDVSRDDGMNLKRKGRLEKKNRRPGGLFVWTHLIPCSPRPPSKRERTIAASISLNASTRPKRAEKNHALESFPAEFILFPAGRRRLNSYERILAEGGQLGDAGRFEAPVPDEVPKIEMRKVGDARVSPLHYGDDAAEGV